MIKKCVGIISWLPDDERREARVNRLNNLLTKIKELFDLPVIIVAQNWNNGEIHLTGDHTVYYYDKLGITGARQELRRKLLESEYDYFILCDDDIIIKGDSGEEYLNEIELHPYGYSQLYGHLLNLFAISRFALEKCDIPNISVDDNTGFEDCCFIWLLRHKVRGVEFQFGNVGLTLDFEEKNDGLESTWSIDKPIKKLYENTKKYYQQVVDECSKEIKGEN